MRTGHGENVRCLVDQRSRQRLAAQSADINTFGLANLHCIKTWRLPADGVHTGGRDFNVFAIPDKTTEKAFRNRAAANISRTNKKDAFHGCARASVRICNLESNRGKSTRPPLRFRAKY
jgi:hypothetical protein